MNVILIQDVDKLGSAGEKLEVKDGYARNCLIPQKLAVEATRGALRILENARKHKEQKSRKLKKECEQLAEKLKKISATVSVEAGDEDKLFGSVTSEMIAESLSSEGIEIDKRKIVLEEPIKALGVYNVDIKLHPEVKAQVRIWVVKE
ncbi:MAG: 50S ribosomal protein L9 [Candidatus Omnitrophica bacterium]|nr:50S ribosomal protein L9 [Candidatus Omnitrophota bacterium]